MLLQKRSGSMWNRGPLTLALAATSILSCMSGTVGKDTRAATQAPTSQDFAILGHSVWLYETLPQARVFGGHVGGSDSVNLIGRVAVDYPAQVYGDSVNIGEGASTGDVFTNHFTSDGTHGNVFPFVSLPSFDQGTSSPGTTSVFVRPGGTVRLGPGAYGDISVAMRGTLVLTGGTYDVQSITLSDFGRITAQAPAALRIAGALSLDPEASQQVTIDIATGLRARDFDISADSVDLGAVASVHAIILGNSVSIGGFVSGALAGGTIVFAGSLSWEDGIAPDRPHP